MFENFNALVKKVESMERKHKKKDLSIKLTDKEVIEIDKSLGDYKEPKQTIAGWSFGWK